ncbi:hypothetical protein AVEN_264185-1 [Araneus ventricosus]|uniref:DUF4371 domain-containing protein n=1 Tax=Araneus ventricosus TaxID=182803 RepID=A0A4Y2IUR8_ARAVE|nr:hypothetical protein AVEN_264185-1 [Araneus ventricosus]
MSQITRYVNIKDGEESFVDFIIIHQKTGRNLTEEIIQTLSSEGLDIQNCRDQGFDNGWNMEGKYEDVQEHIFKINDLAKFVPYAAYSLNLVGVHAAESVSCYYQFFLLSRIRSIQRESIVIVKIFELEILTNLHVSDLPESENHNFGIISVCVSVNTITRKL